MRRSKLQRGVFSLLVCLLLPHLLGCASVSNPRAVDYDDDRTAALPPIGRGDEVLLKLVDGSTLVGQVGRVTRDAIQVDGEWIDRADIVSAAARETGTVGPGMFFASVAVGLVTVSLAVLVSLAATVGSG